MKNIIVEHEGYGLITLNRPEKYNAIHVTMAKELKNALLELKEIQPPFLVIRGSDKSFCAGGDLNEFHSELTNEEAFEKLSIMREVLVEIIKFPVPVICLLNGKALGGGAELATACDFRIAKESAECGFVQSNIGILPGWGGGALLYEKVSPSFAYYWITTGKMLSGKELKQNGWVHEVVPEKAWQLDKVLAPYLKNTFEQMAFLKKQYHQSICIEMIETRMLQESEKCAELWGSNKHKEYIEQFNKRK